MKYTNLLINIKMCQNFIEPMIMTVIQYPKNLKECVGEGEKHSKQCNVIDP